VYRSLLAFTLLTVVLFVSNAVVSQSLWVRAVVAAVGLLAFTVSSWNFVLDAADRATVQNLLAPIRCVVNSVTMSPSN
jgi:hypothetical protein